MIEPQFLEPWRCQWRLQQTNAEIRHNKGTIISRPHVIKITLVLKITAIKYCWSVLFKQSILRIISPGIHTITLKCSMGVRHGPLEKAWKAEYLLLLQEEYWGLDKMQPLKYPCLFYATNMVILVPIYNELIQMCTYNDYYIRSPDNTLAVASRHLIFNTWIIYTESIQNLAKII